MPAMLRSASALVLLVGSAIWVPAFAQDRSITIAVSEEPEAIEPCRALRSNIGRVIKQNVVETLTEIDANDSSVGPRLATEWERVDDLTWRFKLRSGVKFHDGADFNAAAAAYSITRSMNKELDCLTRTALKYTTRVIDDTTLEVVTDVASPILPLVMGTMLIVSPNMPDKIPAVTPIGTGPYVFGEWRRGQDLVLTRFDGYWGEKPEVEKATYVFRTEPAVRAAMVAAGEADIAVSITANDADNPETDTSYLNAETAFMRIDLQIPPLDDIRVRKALNYAIDREAIRGTILSKDVVVATQNIVPNVNGYNPDLKPWPYDPAQAKALLAEAKADGVPIDTEITIYGRRALHAGVVEKLEAMTAMLTDVGFNVKLVMVETAEWLELHAQPHPEGRAPNLLDITHDNSNGDAFFTVWNQYYSTGRQSVLNDPEIDGLIEKASESVNPERQELWREVFRKVFEEHVAYIPEFHMADFSRVGPRINFTPLLTTSSEIQIGRITFK